MTTWTTDRPKVEGIYWMQRPGEPARVVRVWGQCERHGPDMLSMIGSEAWDQMVDRYCPSSTVWYGPIVAPAKTKEWNCECGARIAIACKCAILRMP